MSNQSWVLCPICNNKTRTKIRDDTELINVPLFCPKCKQETLINIKHGNIIIGSYLLPAEQINVHGKPCVP